VCYVHFRDCSRNAPLYCSFSFFLRAISCSAFRCNKIFCSSCNERFLLEVGEPKATRFEKVLLAGVLGFEGWFERLPFNGVDLPDTGGIGHKVAKAELKLRGGGFLAFCAFEDARSRPEKSSIATEHGRKP
jgi:hypothetical protein